MGREFNEGPKALPVKNEALADRQEGFPVDNGRVIPFSRVMEALTDYQRTVILYCREFISEIREIDEVTADHDNFDDMLLLMLDRGEFGPGMFREVTGYLDDLTAQLLIAYSRDPNDTLLDSLYRRAGSPRDMCAAVLEHR